MFMFVWNMYVHEYERLRLKLSIFLIDFYFVI